MSLHKWWKYVLFLLLYSESQSTSLEMLQHLRIFTRNFSIQDVPSKSHLLESQEQVTDRKKKSKSESQKLKTKEGQRELSHHFSIFIYFEEFTTLSLKLRKTKKKCGTSLLDMEGKINLLYIYFRNVLLVKQAS